MTDIAAKRTIFLAFPTGTNAHLCIFMTDPIGNEDARAVMVNISTYRDLPTQDKTVILDVGDHPYIKHKSVVAYDFARFVNVGAVQKIIDDNACQFDVDVSNEIYNKILTGLLESKRTPGNVKTFCRNNTSLIE